MATEVPLRIRLIEAGVEILETEGLVGVSLRAVTRRADVSHGAPRRYFPTHSALLASIAATGLEDLAERLAPVFVDSSTDPICKLKTLAAEYVSFAERRPSMFELMFRHDLLEGAGGNLRATSLPLFEAVVDLVSEDSIPIADRRRCAAAIWASVHGIAVTSAGRSMSLIDPDIDAGSLAADVIDACLGRWRVDAGTQ